MRKAYVTVYFSLVLSVCMGMFSVLFTGVRENALRMRAREAMQISLDSAFGEYNRYIWDHYRIILVDSGYESNTNSMVVAEDHFTECMNKNFNESGIELLGSRDLLKLHCSGTEAEKIRFVTDNNCSAIKHQAVEYMSYRAKIGYLEDIYKSLFDADDMASNIDELNEKYSEAKETLDDETVPAIFSELEISEDMVFLDKDGEISPFSLLRLIIKDTGSVSTTEMKKDSLFSERTCNKGNYGINDDFSYSDKLLLREYLLSVTSNYITGLEDSCMDYETEYLVSGKYEDDRNLENVAYRILLIREALNYISFKKDDSKRNSVELIAAALALLFMEPDLKDSISTVITTAWVSWESISDVKAILAGEKRPLIKEASEWETGFKLTSLTGKNKLPSDKGMGYTDYLRLFLINCSDDKLMERFANLMELNVRENTSLNEFRIDSCFDAWEVTSYVESDYGYTYMLTRVRDVESY